MFTDKRKSLTVDYNNPANFMRFTDKNRRQSDISKVKEESESYTSEKSFSSERNVHNISSKGVSELSDFENIDQIAVEAFSRTKKKIKKKLYFKIFSFYKIYKNRFIVLNSLSKQKIKKSLHLEVIVSFSVSTKK